MWMAAAQERSNSAPPEGFAHPTFADSKRLGNSGSEVKLERM